MGNKESTFLSQILNSRKGENLKDADLKEYRWFWSEKSSIWEEKVDNEKWNIFPLELSHQIEHAYINQIPFESGSYLIFFEYPKSRHIMINSSNAWKQKLVLRSLPNDIPILRKKILNKFTPLPLKNDNTKDFRQNAIAELKTVIYEDIFLNFEIDELSPLLSNFFSHYIICTNSFFTFLGEKYQSYLKVNFEQYNKQIFTFDLLKKILIKDFDDKSVYYTYYLKNLNENNFCISILNMFLEESSLYLDLLEFPSNCTNANALRLTTFYLCLCFALKEQCEKFKSNFITYYYSNYTFKEGEYYMSQCLFPTSKNNFNHLYDDMELKVKRIDIKVVKEPYNSILCLNQSPFDVSKHSMFNDQMVIFPSNSVFLCTKINEKSVELLAIQDYLSTSIKYMTQIDKICFGIYEEISNNKNEDNKNVLYAKLKQKQIGFTSNMRNVRNIDIYGTDIEKEGMMLFSSNVIFFPHLISLSIMGSSLGTEGLALFNNNAKYVPFLRYLNLSYDNIHDYEIKALRLSQFKYLEFIILKENYISNGGMTHIAYELEECRFLRVLDMFNNNINDEGFIHFCERLHKWTNLEQLNLYSCNITDKSFSLFCNKIIQNDCCLSLEKLNFKNNKICDDTYKLLIECLNKLERLNYLNFTQTLISQSDVSNILTILLSKNPLWKYNNQSGELTTIVPASAEPTQEQNKIKKYKKVKYIFNDMVHFTLNIHSFYFTTIFDFSDCKLGDKGLITFFSYLPNLPNIEILILCFNNLTASSFQNFSSYSTYLPHVRKIDLSSNYLKDKGLMYLSEGIEKCIKLETLLLCWNIFSTKGVKYLSSKFNKMLNIKELDLYGNDIKDEGITLFNEYAENLKNLQCLNIGKNKIGNKGLKALGISMLKLPGLRNLNICSNAFNDDGLMEFTSNIRPILKLESFDISDNDITEDMINILSFEGVHPIY